jgi:RNA polymerase sigma-70 factor (ECF subfamily)
MVMRSHRGSATVTDAPHARAAAAQAPIRGAGAKVGSDAPAEADRPVSAHDGAGMVRHYGDAVYRLLYRLSRDTHDTEDLTQETFLRALERADTFREGTDLRSWLLRIATNLFLDLCRRRKTGRAGELQGDPVDAGQQPGWIIQNAELGDLLGRAIARLPATARAVFVLRAQEEMSFRAIAQVLGATEETARWHMMQARRALMKDLEGKI